MASKKGKNADDMVRDMIRCSGKKSKKGGRTNGKKGKKRAEG